MLVSDHISAVKTYMTALTSPDDPAAKAVADVLADDVVVETNFARAEGTEAVIALLGEPRIAGLAAGARWSEPSASGDRVSVTLTPSGPAPFGGLDVVFVFAGSKIARVEQQVLPAAPPEPVGLRLTDHIKNAINGALDNGTPMQIAYCDDGGEIRLSFRGTIQAYGDDQLALWARDPEGGLPRNIAGRPRVTLLYHDPATRTTYSFYGRARAEHDPAARTRIFDSSPPREQQMDFRRRGIAIVVDLDKVEGRDPGGRFLMLRA
jgi:Pyridoxamine 5'-phosphate oxidase